MNTDIRFPIGLMFTILGLVLGIYGMLTNSDSELYTKSLGVNINLWSGLAMLIFGLLMLGFSLRKKKKLAKD